jgi:hypothetical protein
MVDTPLSKSGASRHIGSSPIEGNFQHLLTSHTVGV